MVGQNLYSEPESTPVDFQEDLQVTTQKRVKRGRSGSKVTVDDFELIRVLGKGCAGKVCLGGRVSRLLLIDHFSSQVVLVKHKALGGLFAMKAIIKRHVIAHSELQHTLVRI